MSESDVLHRQRKDLGFQMQAQDRKAAQTSDEQVHFLTFDLQKTLPLPKLSTSIAFYLRQVWLYNLGVHIVSSTANGGFFQVWTEDEGGRGCEEVCSALLAFLDVSGVRNGHSIAWSDSCSGQNKNLFTVCLWQLLIKQQRFSCIDHKFPETGHTYMDSDRDFAQIEKTVKKRENIYSLDEYIQIMTTCIRKPKSVVTTMKNRFYNIKGLPQLLGLKKPTYNTSGEKISFRDNVRWIRVSTFGEYQYRESLDDSAPWKTVKLISNENEQHDWDSSVVSLLKPMATQPINRKKWLDIQKQLPYIPEGHQGFYRNLTAANDETSGRNAKNLNDADDMSTPSLNPSQSSSGTAGCRAAEGQVEPTQKRRKSMVESVSGRLRLQLGDANNLNDPQPAADLGNYSSNSSFVKSRVDLSRIIFSHCYIALTSVVSLLSFNTVSSFSCFKTVNTDELGAFV